MPTSSAAWRNDALLAGRGADFLDGGVGRDTHDAGPGNDLVATSYDGARDVVRCGTGLDVVNADLPDIVASDCELVGRRLSRDPYRGDGAQHETEVEPDSLTVGRTTVAAFQVGRRLDGAATNVGFAVSTDDGASWRSGLSPASPSRAARRARTRERAIPSSRTTRPTRRGSSRPSPSRVRRHGSRSTARPTDSCGTALSRRARNASPRESRSTRTGSRATTLVVALLRPLLPRVHPLRRSRMLAVTWSDDGGLTWFAPVDLGVRGGVGVFPAIRSNGDLVVVYLLQVGQFAIAASRSADGGAPGARRCASRPSTVAAGSVTPAHSRCRRPRSTRRVGSGRRGTTARHPVRRGTRCSWPRPPRAPGGAPHRGDTCARRGSPGDRDRRRDGARRHRLHALESSRYRRRAHDLARRSRNLDGAPATVGAVHASAVGPTRRPAACWATTSRCTTRWQATRRLGARERACWLELPPGGVRDARLRRQSPIGCQTVFSSRNAEISQGSARRRSSGRRA